MIYSTDMDQNILIESQTTDQTPATPMSTQVSDNNSLKYIALGIVLIILVGVGGYLVGQRSSDTSNEAGNTTLIPTQESVTPSISVDQATWLTYGSKDVEGKYDGWMWKPFVLHYPSTWSIAEEIYSNESGPTFALKLTKVDGSYFELLQGFAEGGRCVYENDPDSSTYFGAGSAYTTYDEIVKGDEKWRLSAYKVPDQLWTHQLCGLSKNGVYQSGYNSLGIHKIKLVNEVAYAEFLEMLKKVEIK